MRLQAEEEGNFSHVCKGAAVTDTCPWFFNIYMQGLFSHPFHQLDNWQGNYRTRLDFQSVVSNAECEEEDRVRVRPYGRRNQVIEE